MKCQRCDDQAVGVFDLPYDGANKHPRMQVFCMHHAFSYMPQAGMMLVKDLSKNEVFTRMWIDGRGFSETVRPRPRL